MDFYMKLPRNKKEFVLFLTVISIISVNIIAPLITFFETGFHLATWIRVLKIIPLIWISVILLVLLTFKPAEAMTRKILSPDDSFNAHILTNIFCTVFLMSVFLTVIGTWIGCQKISLDPITGFFHKWPRNFSISLFVELLIAQPAARLIMLWMHQRAELPN